MPLTSTQEMLLAAQAGHYALCAFNIENMEMAQAVVAAARELRAPVILQTTPSTVRYAGLAMYHAMAAALAADADIPVALHLDHGESFDLAAQAVRQGYTSVMIDGSHLSFEENIALTASVAAIARPNGIPVEAELGKVGGKEDDLEGDGAGYTDPSAAADFADRARCTSLAVAIGTAHGVYKIPPKLDVERLSAIRAAVDIPLVLHGASGLSDDDVRECVKRGACKVNFATELRIAYSDGVKAYLAKNPDTFDPKKYGAAGREKVMETVRGKIAVCGSEGKGRL